MFDWLAEMERIYLFLLRGYDLFGFEFGRDPRTQLGEEVSATL